MIEVEGEPSDWIVEGGRPARWCGLRGMPSYESDDGTFLVFDLLCVKDGGLDIPPMMFPRSYLPVCCVAPDGLVPLYRSDLCNWRPQVYRFKLDEGWERLSSQNELTWRQGLSEVTIGLLEILAQGLTGDEADEHLRRSSDVGRDAAWERAERLLRENLSPFQEFEFVVGKEFRVRGGKTGNLYVIRPSNGFALIDPVTCSEIASYCLHPENWLPDADVALATKLALEDPELEIECLENARGGPSAIGTSYRPTRFERAAAERERELIT